MHSGARFDGLVPLVQVDIGLLADQVGVATADTLDLGQGVHDLLFTIDVGVQKTQNLDSPNVSLTVLHPSQASPPSSVA
jgi:hypothetical protein